MIRKATAEDVPFLTDFFWTNMTERPAYISHGEFQMGVAVPAAEGGTPAENGKTLWSKYVADKIAGADSTVLVFDEGSVGGFAVLAVEKDGAAPFGVICDLLVAPEMRGRGIGDRLLAEGMRWLRERGVRDVYLESGKNNHAAHAFFEKRGFGLVSHVFARFE